VEAEAEFVVEFHGFGLAAMRREPRCAARRG
jgi:hypothetical protein